MADCYFHGNTGSGPCPYCEQEDRAGEERGTRDNPAPLTMEDIERNFQRDLKRQRYRFIAFGNAGALGLLALAKLGVGAEAAVADGHLKAGGRIGSEAAHARAACLTTFSRMCLPVTAKAKPKPSLAAQPDLPDRLF